MLPSSWSLISEKDKVTQMTGLYKDNKKLIKTYVLAALIFSIVMCCSSIGSAAGDTDVPALFGGGFGSTFEQAAEFAFGTSISPSYVMGLSSALSILREAGVDLLPDITFGLCDMWVVRILSFLWVALTMLGPVIGEEMEKINTKYVGPIMIFVFELIMLLGLNKGGTTVNAAGFGIGCQEMSVAGGILLGILEFFKIIIMLAVYFFVRYFNYAVSVLFSLITGMNSTLSAVYRILRALFATIFLLLAEYCPYVFYFFYAVLILISVLVFRWAYRIINYFKAIYVAPVKWAVFHNGKDAPLEAKRCPRKLKGSGLAVPLYSLFRKAGSVPTKVRTKWWLSKDEEGPYLYLAPFLKRKEQILRLEGLYIRESGLFHKGFYEISDIDRKEARLVFSREYKSVLDKILENTGFGDYRVIAEQKKEAKRIAREQKKEERKNAREERKNKFLTFINGGQPEESDDLI